MGRNFAIATFCLLVLSTASACDSPEAASVAEPEASAFLRVEPAAPPRPLGKWGNATASAMWDYISARDSAVIVGMKLPQQNRGIWRSQSLVSNEQLEALRAQAFRPSGIRVERKLPRLPAYLVKLSDLSALERLRGAPIVDYVEPNATQVRYESSPSGCAWENYTGNPQQSAPLGDYMPSNYIRSDADVDQAWNRSTGAGVTIGLIDTGIATTQDQLISDFSAGASTGRWVAHFGVGSHSPWMVDCSHGTRMAGVLAAPHDGDNMLGVAWNSNLISVKQANKVWGVDAAEVVDAIELAAGHRDSEFPNHRIVAMAFHADGRNAVEDMIRFWHSQDRLFVAAAGSMDYAGIAFPADMPEVMAVSAVSSDYGELGNMNYGSEVDVSFVVNQLSPGADEADLTQIGGSSGAAAIVAGIAALAWAAFPAESAQQIRQRIWRSGHQYPDHDRVAGYGVVDALHAVGGLRVELQARMVYGSPKSPTETWELSANVDGGDGPFTYNWGHGADTATTTVVVGICDPPTTYSVRVTDAFDGSSQIEYRTIYPSMSGQCSGSP